MALAPETTIWLERRFAGKVKYNEPMARYTSLKVGGPAEAMVVPETVADLETLIRYCLDHDESYQVVGGGTNLLVKDNGIAGIVIVMAKGLDRIRIEHGEGDRARLTAMAGTRLQKVCAQAIRKGLKGMNFALGIPGTVGGAVIMNAGTQLGAMADVLEAVDVLLPVGGDAGVVTERLPRQRLNLSYRAICCKNGRADVFLSQPIILAAQMALTRSNADALKAEAREILGARRRTQPTHLPNAGCFFKNPARGRPAGELIDRAGLKGTRRGGAQVSARHANFIVNAGGASAQDIIDLMALVRKTVAGKFNVTLEPEVKTVGF